MERPNELLRQTAGLYTQRLFRIAVSLREPRGLEVPVRAAKWGRVRERRIGYFSGPEMRISQDAGQLKIASDVSL
jgi:hypothetical protein